jgi:hypothetical protein
MAHYNQLRKHNETADNEPAPELLEHLASLGLKTIDEYSEWCARHGFSRRLNKHWRQRLKERSFHTEAICLAHLSQKKKERRKPDKIIEAIFDGDLDVEGVVQPHLKQICRAFDAAKTCDRTRQAFLDLLLHTGARSKLLLPRLVIAEYGRTAGNTFVGGLLALARFSQQWLRPLVRWKPQTHNVRRQFSSLARHLLAEWPVPAFMDTASGLTPVRVPGERHRSGPWKPRPMKGEQNCSPSKFAMPLT